MQNLYAFGAIVTGLITITLLYYKPSSYWDKPSIRFVRSLIGNKATTILYFFLSFLLILLGILVMLKIHL